MKRFGPGLLVTAAFIGPGTLTTAAKAGAGFGFALLWAVLFSIVATIVLQEMAARLGIATRNGLGEALRSTSSHPLPRYASILLVIAAIAIGNCAFQFGNITGASLGIESILGFDRRLGALLVAALAFGCLAHGRYKLLETLLIALVALMSLVFIATAIMSRPDLGSVANGLFVPRLPEGSLLTIVALIGTTVVPYNLFLHASAVREKWPSSIEPEVAIREARTDTLFAVGLGGLVTAAIVMTAAATFFGSATGVTDAASMAAQLEPALGPFAKFFFALGLFAAGLTSAITAPLAAAYATSGALGWKADLKDWRFRSVWACVLAIGTVLALTGRSPIEGIVFAQAANGILLPIVAIFLLIAVNRSDLMGPWRNSRLANLLGGAVVMVAAGLGVLSIAKAAGWM